MIYIVIVIISFILSVFFSASETAFSVVNRLKIKLWAKAGRKSAGLTEKFLNNPESFLVPTLVGTNISNILFASSVIHMLFYFKLDLNSFEVTLAETLFIVLFAEIIPKLTVKSRPELFMFIIIFPFMVMRWILFPANIFISFLSRHIMRFLKIQDSSEPLLITREDIESVIDEAVEVSGFNKEHAEFIDRIMLLKSVKIKEVMTHRKSISALEIGNTVYQLKKIVEESSFSKIPVYDENFDNIKGIIYTDDIIYNKHDLKPSETIDSLIIEPRFFPENTNIHSLFRLFKREKLSMGVVIDEYGGCTGIVTMQDILNFIVGESTGFHRKEKVKRGISYREENNSLIVNGHTSIDKINSMLTKLGFSDRVRIEEETFDTLNGFIINYLGKIPENGEEFSYNRMTFEIVKASKNIVDTIVIYLPKK